MSASVLGLDISSYQLNACLLVGDQAPVLRVEVLGDKDDPLIERVRRVSTVVASLCAGADWVVIEDVQGPYWKVNAALNRIVGALIASCPANAQIAVLSTGDWRGAIGAEGKKKSDGHVAVEREISLGYGPSTSAANFDEHELDAIGVALGFKRILEAPENARTACECGCGQITPIAKRTRLDLGHVRGKPVRLMPSHSLRWSSDDALQATPDEAPNE